MERKAYVMAAKEILIKAVVQAIRLMLWLGLNVIKAITKNSGHLLSSFNSM
jgi:hypothetical protein